MDKYQEALDYLECITKAFNVTNDISKLSIENLQDLIDKATPKKLTEPYFDGYEVLSGYCPICGLEQEHMNDDYCVDCGQRLDWSVE